MLCAARESRTGHSDSRSHGPGRCRKRCALRRLPPTAASRQGQAERDRVAVAEGLTRAGAADVAPADGHAVRQRARDDAEQFLVTCGPADDEDLRRVLAEHADRPQEVRGQHGQLEPQPDHPPFARAVAAVERQPSPPSVPRRLARRPPSGSRRREAARSSTARPSEATRTARPVPPRRAIAASAAAARSTANRSSTSLPAGPDPNARTVPTGQPASRAQAARSERRPSAAISTHGSPPTSPPGGAAGRRAPTPVAPAARERPYPARA